MIICPLTQKECEGETCSQVRHNPEWTLKEMRLIACEKVEKSKIYVFRDGKLVEMK